MSTNKEEPSSPLIPARESKEDPRSPLSPRVVMEGAKQMISLRLLRRHPIATSEASISARRRFRFLNKASMRRVRENVRQNALRAQARLGETRAISAAQYYFLSTAALLLAVALGGQMLLASLNLLARAEVMWWLTRSAKLDDFRLWTLEQCSAPWNGETLICQALL